MGSIIVPDFLFLKNNGLKWIQPLAFNPNFLIENQKDIVCNIQVGISCGYTINIKFKSSDFIRKFKDGSELYKCTIIGPKDLESFITGEGEFKDDKTPFIKLYHHTQKEFKRKILESNYLKDSPWNVSGNLKLKNAGYVYFTCLDEIKYQSDLQKIAMGERGKIKLITDLKDDILILDVTKKDLSSLNAKIPFYINVSAIAPSHLFKHIDDYGLVWYEISWAFIYRVGVYPQEKGIKFDNKIIENKDIKLFDYVIVGDCTTVEGLAAPYDEENTDYILKIEKTNDENILEFWFNNCNQDHFSNKIIEQQEFCNSD